MNAVGIGVTLGASALVGGAVGFGLERMTTPGQVEQAERFDAWYSGLNVPTEFVENVERESPHDAAATIGIVGGIAGGIGAMFALIAGIDGLAPRTTLGLGAVSLAAGAAAAAAGISYVANT